MSPLLGHSYKPCLHLGTHLLVTQVLVNWWENCLVERDIPSGIFSWRYILFGGILDGTRAIPVTRRAISTSFILEMTLLNPSVKAKSQMG